jgi:hypothetical protein
MYKKRMIGYYPAVIQKITEFKGIIDAEYPEFDDISAIKDSITDNAYLTTMGESRIEEWEKIFGIRPVEGSTVDDRRETIIARIRGNGKLNTALINSIVKTFTGGAAKSWVKDSVLYVEITPPNENKNFIFDNVEQELKHKVPAHLGFNINRNYCKWVDIKNECATWSEVNAEFSDWNDVKFFVISNTNVEATYALDENGNQLVDENGSILYY